MQIHIAANNEVSPRLSCDGQARVEVPIGATIRIKKKEEQLTLIHPEDYNYFETLRTKLYWHSK